MTTDRVYTTKEACQMLGVSLRTIRYWIASGKAVPSTRKDRTDPRGGSYSWTLGRLRKIARDTGRELQPLAEEAAT